MNCDSSIDIAPDLTLDVYTKGVRTKVRLTRTSARQMAIKLRETAVCRAVYLTAVSF